MGGQQRGNCSNWATTRSRSISFNLRRRLRIMGLLQTIKKWFAQAETYEHVRKSERPEEIAKHYEKLKQEAVQRNKEQEQRNIAQKLRKQAFLGTDGDKHVIVSKDSQWSNAQLQTLRMRAACSQQFGHGQAPAFEINQLNRGLYHD